MELIVKEDGRIWGGGRFLRLKRCREAMKVACQKSLQSGLTLLPLSLTPEGLGAVRVNLAGGMQLVPLISSPLVLHRDVNVE